MVRIDGLSAGDAGHLDDHDRGRRTTIEGDGLTLEVNKKLYGLTLEEVNHGIDGGLYAELIQNRSFEDGVPPLNCPYDAVSRRLRTPNGWYIPFIPADSIPGWRALTNTWIWMDTKEVPYERGAQRS